MRRITLILLLIEIILAVLVIRYYPNFMFQRYSDTPTSYSAGIEYGIQYTTSTGHLLTDSADVEYYTPYTSGVLVAQNYRTGYLLNVAITLITGNDISGALLGTILHLIFITVILAFVFKLRQLLNDSNEKVEASQFLYILLFVLFGSYTLFQYYSGLGNAGIVLIWIGLILLLLTYNNPASKVLYIFIMFSIPMFYPTPGVILPIFFLSMIVLHYIYKKLDTKENIRIGSISPVGAFILYITFWFGWNLYATPVYFSSLVSTINSFIIPDQSSITGYNFLSPYIIQSSTYSLTLNLLNGIFVACPVIFYVASFRRNNLKRDGYVLLSLIIALPILAIIFYLMRGFWIVFQRMAVWGSFVSMVVFTYLMIARESKSLKILKLSAPLAILTSLLLIFSISGVNRAYALTTIQEDNGGRYLANHIPMESAVFTDHRLVGPFVSEAHLNVNGINDISLNKSIIVEELNAVYYGNDPQKAYEIISGNYYCDYVYLSMLMTKSPPGIKGYDYFFEPADVESFAKYNQSPNFYRIYSNGETASFYISNA